MKWATALLLLIISIVFLLLSPLSWVPSSYAQTCKVDRVTDGDTLLLTNGEYVRLIGVDTPETKHPKKPVEYFGKEAYLFTKRMVEGKEVGLEYDQTRRDRYNRILAYAYLSDGTFLNAEIIKQGYGFAYTKYPFKYMEEFRGYEREARENKRGLLAGLQKVPNLGLVVPS
jgi:micrococcal nuclease